ncbi:MAG TPA: hypothetical protein DDY39_17335 [Nitrospira sp.]|nr:hypothetical protein [Nitrospira sp.]HBR51840.1 hypothetical protein [Nitrospira sp.]
MTSLSRIVKQVALLGMLFLTGCATGAMRIDVDVYKGPLTQTWDGQLASLIGYLQETKRELIQNLNTTLMIVAHNGFLEPNRRIIAGGPPIYVESVSVQDFLANSKEMNRSENSLSNDNERLYLYFPSQGKAPANKSDIKTPHISDAISWCDELDAQGPWDLMMTYASCHMLRSVYIDSLDMLQDLEALLKSHKSAIGAEDETRKLLDAINNIATKFHLKTKRWAKAHMAGASPDCTTRMAVMSFSLFASESGNQLQARADALRKQLGIRAGIDTQELALSTYLQDVQPTDFVHLFDWFEASADGCGGGDWFRRNVLNFIGFPSINVQDRVKVLKRLYADHYWSRINTVHSSAPGKGNMVFVKDEIGNWNLKNFESYPGELIDAYMNVGKTMLETAAKIGAASSGVGAGGVALEAAFKFANQAIADSPSTMAGTLLLKELENNEKDLIGESGRKFKRHKKKRK